MTKKILPSVFIVLVTCYSIIAQNTSIIKQTNNKVNSPIQSAVKKVVIQPDVKQNNGQSPIVQIQTGHNEIIDMARYSKDGRYVISYSQSNSQSEKVLIVWDVKTGRLIHRMSGKLFMDIAPDSTFVTYDEKSDLFEFWDFNTFSIKKSFKKNSTNISETASILPDVKYFVAAGGSIYELSSGKLIKSLDIRKPGESYNQIGKMALSKDNSILVASTYFGTIYFYSTKDWSQIKVITNELKNDLGVKQTDFSLSPDGKYIVLSYPWNKEINIISMKDFQPVKSFTAPYCEKDFGVAYTVFSKDGKIMTVGDKFGPILFYDTENWNMKSKVDVKNSNCLEFSPNDAYFLTSEFCDVNIYTREGTLLSKYQRNIKDLRGIEYNKELELLCSSANSGIQLWDLKELKLNYTLKDFSKGVLSSKGHYLAAYDNKYTTSGWKSFGILVNLEKKITLAQFDFSIFCRDIAFSNDEKYFVSHGKDKTINIYDISKGSTNTISLSQNHYYSSNEHFVINPLSNEMVIFGNISEMAYYNFDNGQLSYNSNYKAPDNRQNEMINDLVFSPTGDVIGFSYRPGTSAPEYFCTYNKELNETKSLLWNRTNLFTGGMGISPDGKKLIIPSNPFFVINSQTGDTLKKFALKHTDYISGLTFAKGDKNIYSSSNDGTMRLWDYESGDLILTLVPAKNTDDYVFITPDGYYKSTKQGTMSVHYVLGNKVITFDQLDLKYNRPDIVLQRAGAESSVITAYHNAYLKRLKKMGFTEKDIQSDLNLPELDLLTNNIPVSTENKQMTIRIKASDKKYELNRINLYVNDVPVFGQMGVSLKDQHLKDIEKEISFELVSGKNKVQISAMNSAGIESFRENFTITYTGATPKPALYLVAIGISDYLNKDYNLTYAAKDAQDLESLAKSYAGQYSEVNTVLLTDKNATAKNILETKSTLLKSKPDDIVILFVASHGLLDKNLDYYIATTDCDFNNPSINGLAYDKLESLLDGIPARNKLMLIDACHSGEVDKDEKVVFADNAASNSSNNGVKSRGFKSISNASGKSIGLNNSFELMNEIFADVRKGTGAIVISSAGGMEFAFESSEWKNGVFTYSILEGIKTKNADASKDGKISVSELRDYVGKRVEELTSGKQHPTSRTENLENDFRVW